MEPRSPEERNDLGLDAGGWNRALGLRLTEMTSSRVVGEWDVEERHLQPYGIVHGGVYCSVIETVCSMGAAMSVLEQGLSVVGLDNHTSFVRATREGRLVVVATPLTRGRRSQLWEATIRNEATQIVATGRVRLLCIENGADLAGRAVSSTGG